MIRIKKGGGWGVGGCSFFGVEGLCHHVSRGEIDGD